MTTALNVIIADDHPLFRTALKETISQIFPAATLYEASNISTLQQCVIDHNDVDLILLDLHMPGAHGFSGLIHLSSHHSDIPVVIISAHETPDIMHRAIQHGAAGFLPKSCPVEMIAEAINAILQGDIWLPGGIETLAEKNEEEMAVANALSALTPQQFRVATMLAEGLLNKQIAYDLNVTEATIKAHLTEIFKKLGVNSRTQAVLAISQLDVQAPSMSLD